jgi:hypothetical protein
MPEGTRKQIRDFIYLDVPRLYSFYSQMFGGLTDRIVEERIIEKITGESAPGPKGGSADSESSEASRRTESVVLHDHMYNRLEQELNSSVLDASTIDWASHSEEISANPIVKITGRAEIEDYDRYEVYAEHFNQIAETIAYAQLSGKDTHKDQVLRLAEQIANEPNNGKRKTLEDQLRRLTDAKPKARELGLLQDPKLLENLKFFARLFRPSAYEVIITPHEKPIMHYRGVLNKDWLRYSPELITAMCGGQSEFAWTMVGTVTHLPRTFVDPSAQETAVPKDERPAPRTPEEQEDDPMMLDAFRNMFRHERKFERMFLESDISVDIVLLPLAIYREFDLPLAR